MASCIQALNVLKGSYVEVLKKLSSSMAAHGGFRGKRDPRGVEGREAV